MKSSGCENRRREGQGRDGLKKSGNGVGDAQERGGGSHRVPTADADADAAASGGDVDGGLCRADEGGGDTGGCCCCCGGERNDSGDNGLETETGDGNFGGGFPVAAPEAAAAGAGIADEKGCRDPAETEETKRAVSDGGIGGGREQERWRWRRALRRMVDANSPSVSEQVKSRG